MPTGISEAIDKLEKIRDASYELYNDSCDNTPPEFYATMLGIHELADLALEDLRIREKPGKDA